MKNIIIIIISIFSQNCFSQKNGQSFCDGDQIESYFPLTIKKKKIIWQNTFYIEAKTGEKTINGKNYIVYDQIWEGRERYSLYLRKEESKILQYEECCNEETVRFDDSFNKGQIWQTADKLTEYTIESFSGNLKTPYCNYSNLMILKSKFSNGTFKFYYLKGYGYVGATIENQLISYVTPE